jgi:hypothetical protein
MRDLDLDLEWIAQSARAKRARRGQRIQSLWSGYGEIVRIDLEGAASKRESVIVKHVKAPAKQNDRGHQRKLRSYEVEVAWYRNHASRCTDACRVPAFIDAKTKSGEQILILEDLDESGFTARSSRFGSETETITHALSWLASFHATFLNTDPKGLWKTGTYWHLATRPDELRAITDDIADLRAAAPLIDAKLESAKFKTFVHGDAKLPNFCFSRTSCAAVDFQYVGGGCGMKDVAYLISGEPSESHHLTHYFQELRSALASHHTPETMNAIEEEWRALYPIACVDFYRFLAGWSPSHYKHDAHARAVTSSVLRNL